MRGLYRNLSPFTPDSAGVIACFADAPAMVVPFDMNGTVSTFRNRVGVLAESPVRVASALGSREIQYVMGDVSGFKEEAARLLRTYGGEFLVLLHGPVSSMMGADLVAVADELEGELGCPVVAVDCSGSGPYDEGLSKAMLAVFKRLQAPEELPKDSAINLLGLNSIDHNNPALRSLLIESACEATDSDVVSVWGCRDSWPQWEQATLAAENIVMSVSGMRLAQAMKRAWGMPFRRVDELGIDFSYGSGVRIGPSSPNALVVSEQLLGNLARKVLEGLGFQVTVSSFHKMIAAAKEPGDFQMESEADLTRRLASGDYECLVGDSTLRACMPAGAELVFVPLRHSAVSHIGVDEDEKGPVPLTMEWVELAKRALLESARGRCTR